MTKRKPGKAIPQSVFPDDEADETGMDAARTLGFLTLRRWFVAVVQIHEDGSEAVYTLSNHFPTNERAHQELPALRAVVPDAGVISCILAFDPANAEHMARFERMRAETEARPGEALQ